MKPRAAWPVLAKKAKEKCDEAAAAVVKGRERVTQFDEGIGAEAAEHQQAVGAQDARPFGDGLVRLRMPVQRQIGPDQLERFGRQSCRGQIGLQPLDALALSCQAPHPLTQSAGQLCLNLFFGERQQLGIEILTDVVRVRVALMQ